MLIYMLMALYAFFGFLIVAMILLQESKGGGIAAMGGAAVDGVVGVRNPLRRMTAYFSIFFALLALGINTYIARTNKADEELLAPPPVKTAPASTPETPPSSSAASAAGGQEPPPPPVTGSGQAGIAKPAPATPPPVPAAGDAAAGKRKDEHVAPSPPAPAETRKQETGQ